MSSYEDPEDEIDYDPDQQDYDEEDNENFNGEENFIVAEESNNPIEAYKQIIELEISNCDSHKWSFKSYEKLAIGYIKAKNVEEGKVTFHKLAGLYNDIDDKDKQDTFWNITFVGGDVKDFEFEEKAYNELLNALKEKDLDRPYLETGLKYCKIGMSLDKIEKFEGILPELSDYIERMPEDETLKKMKLELFVLHIGGYKVQKNYSGIHALYVQARKGMSDQIFENKRLNAIIEEEGGKIDFQEMNYKFALQKFIIAFHNYKDSGSNQLAITLLKYAFYTSGITRDKSIIVSPEEARVYKNDKCLMAAVKLHEAYDAMDINEINRIWADEIGKNETDYFIMMNKETIINCLKRNYIIDKLKAYKVGSFETLEKEVGVDRKGGIAMAFKISKCGEVKAKVNLVDCCIEVDVEGKNKSNGGIENYKQWIEIFDRK